MRRGEVRRVLLQRQGELRPRQGGLLEDAGRREVDAGLQGPRDDLHRWPLGRVGVDAPAHHAADHRQVLGPHVRQLRVDQLPDLLRLLEVLDGLQKCRGSEIQNEQLFELSLQMTSSVGEMIEFSNISFYFYAIFE